MKIGLEFLNIEIIKVTNLEKIKKGVSETRRAGKFTILFSKIYLIISGLLRLITPLFIFKYPIKSFIAFTILDSLDYNPYMKLGFSQKKYNKIDKALDFYSYIFMTIYAYGSPYFTILLGFLFFRLFGTILFYSKNKHIFLFLFPNLSEPAFLSIVLTDIYSFNIINIFIILLILKMIQEYMAHVYDGGLITLRVKMGSLSTTLILIGSTKKID